MLVLFKVNQCGMSTFNCNLIIFTGVRANVNGTQVKVTQTGFRFGLVVGLLPHWAGIL